MSANVNAFQEFVFRRDDVRALARSTRGPVLAELMPVVERLGRRPLGDFDRVDDVANGPTPAGRLTPEAIGALRDSLIGLVDASLQDLYRGHFRRNPPAARSSHEDRLDSLKVVRREAFDLVRRFDWTWLERWLHPHGGDVESALNRLSNFAFLCKRVNFRFTYHCNASCRHCYNSSGPTARDQRIALESMLRIVAEMPGTGIRALNLTGGEPFLYPDDLVALVAAGRAARLSEISIYTNGFWAASPAQARATLSRLEAAGFMAGAGDYIKVSAGVYHQEFIGLERVLTAARCYHEMFGRRLVLDFALSPDRPDAKHEVLRQLSEAGLTDRADARFRAVQALGRGRDLDFPDLDPVDRPCPAIDQIVFDPDGSARPCCGFNNENQGVRVGRLGQHSLRQLIKRMQNDPILQFLSSRPMNEILAYVDRPKNLAGYAGACNLCQYALGDLTDKEALQGRLFSAQNFYPFWFDGRAVEQSS